MPVSIRIRSTPSAERRRPIGILGAGRFLSDREDADQGVQLVGDGERKPGTRRWQLIAGEAGQVLLGDGRRDLGRIRHRSGRNTDP